MRTFLSSSTSSALRISYPRLSTIASLANRLISKSSLISDIPEDLFHSDPLSTDFFDNCETRWGRGGTLGGEGDDGIPTAVEEDIVGGRV